MLDSAYLLLDAPDEVVVVHRGARLTGVRDGAEAWHGERHRRHWDSDCRSCASGCLCERHVDRLVHLRGEIESACYPRNPKELSADRSEHKDSHVSGRQVWKGEHDGMYSLAHFNVRCTFVSISQDSPFRNVQCQRPSEFKALTMTRIIHP
jgi:hypothetical protein